METLEERARRGGALVCVAAGVAALALAGLLALDGGTGDRMAGAAVAGAAPGTVETTHVMD